jgi:hypothetical protein
MASHASSDVSSPNATLLKAALSTSFFLNYMAMRHANWTAWSFTPNHLILDFNSFTPTTLDIPWTCGDSTSKAGMGTLVKQFLTQS